MIERIASTVVGLFLAVVGSGVIGLDVWRNGQLHAVNGVVGVLFVFAAGLLINTPKTTAIANTIDDKAQSLLPFLPKSVAKAPTQWPPQSGPIQ